MDIVELRVENFLRLNAVSIRPKGRLVELTGKNRQGKTSVLTAIFAALAGKSALPKKAIREGETEAVVQLDLGRFRVKLRVYNNRAGEQASTLQITSEDGAVYPKPQQMLDAMLGELGFDPFAFTRMKPADQFEMLKRLAPGVDFDAVERANKADYTERTDVNRRAADARGRAAAYTFPDGTPEEPVDVSVIAAELETANQTNATVELFTERRAAARAEVAAHRRRAEQIGEEIADLERRIKTLTANATAETESADTLQAKLDAAKPLPEVVDTTEIRAKLAGADEILKAQAARENRRRLEAEAAELEARSEALTAAMAQRTRDKQKAIAAAKIPVAGIGFGDGEILLHGVPFDQASGAERLTASVAIAVALNPKLRIIRVTEGALLDDEAMVTLQRIAEEMDEGSIWIETVQSDRETAVVIEDGGVKSYGAHEQGGE